MMKFRLEIDKKIKDIYDDQQLIDMHNQDLEELKMQHQARMNSKNGFMKEDQLDHVKNNKIVASEWHHVQRELLKSRQDVSAER